MVTLGVLGCGGDASVHSRDTNALTPAGADAPAVCQGYYRDPQVPDSIVLERTPCYGECPAYRVRIARSGAVHFRSRNYGDTARTATAVIDQACVSRVWSEFGAVHFPALPDTIASVSAYCEPAFTDAPRVTVRFFAGGSSKHVVDYQGCLWAPVGLRDLEALIDEIAGSSRWARPNSSLPPPPA
jgi:hypothetical protein